MNKSTKMCVVYLSGAFALCGIVSCNNSSNKEAFVSRPADPSGASKEYEAEQAGKNTGSGEATSKVKVRPNTFEIPGKGSKLPNGEIDPNSGNITEIEGCALDSKDHDFVEFPWPDYIQKCVDQNLLYDFNIEGCSTIPSVDQFKIAEVFTRTEKDFDLPSDGKFDCNWEDALKIQQDYIGISDSPIGEQNRTDKVKLVGCSEVKNAGYYMIVLQYWIPTQQDIDACKVVSNWRIHTSCRQLRESENYPELTWQECLRQ